MIEFLLPFKNGNILYDRDALLVAIEEFCRMYPSCSFELWPRGVSIRGPFALLSETKITRNRIGAVEISLQGSP